MNTNGDKRPDNGPAGEPPDLYEVFMRVVGWVYLGIGAAMLAFFLYWLRGQ